MCLSAHAQRYTNLRKWLCFSPTSKEAYCNICWMSKKDGLVKRTDLHEKSIGHRECHNDFVLFKDRPIGHEMLKHLEEEEKKLSRVI